MFWTCIQCGNEFRRQNQFEFFCNNTCRIHKAMELGLKACDLLNEISDDLALLMYAEYINEINGTHNKAKLLVN